MADGGGRREELPGKSQKPAECRKKLQFFVLFILKIYIGMSHSIKKGYLMHQVSVIKKR